MALSPPDRTDCHDYYWTYIDQVPEGDIFAILEAEIETTASLLAGPAAGRGTYRYADDKWSIRELAGHLADTERLFGYRALSIARGDTVELPGMDQDIWGEGSNAHQRPLASHIEELRAIRASELALFRSFDSQAWQRRGKASGCDFTVKAFPFIIAGHEIHHRRVLEERYLAG